MTLMNLKLGESFNDNEVGILVDGIGSNGTKGEVSKNDGGSGQFQGQRVLVKKAGKRGDLRPCVFCKSHPLTSGAPSGGSIGDPVYVDEDTGALEVNKPTTNARIGYKAGNGIILDAEDDTE